MLLALGKTSITSTSSVVMARNQLEPCEPLTSVLGTVADRRDVFMQAKLVSPFVRENVRIHSLSFRLS
jgi:hypothetical protein